MRRLLTGVAAATLTCSAAWAQTPLSPVALPRADVHVALGWQNLREQQPQYRYNDWLNGIFYGGAGAGWLWTDHLKTQIDFGSGTRGRQYRYDARTLDGNQAYQNSRLSVREQNVSIGQQYQFFRNQLFHPHVGAGVELVRETRTEEFDPLLVYDSSARLTRTITPAHVDGPTRRFLARAFVETGFKAYMTPRVFFTSDARVMFRGRADEVLFRAGFGIDF
jgi:opacity protein-like surface antigen